MGLPGIFSSGTLSLIGDADVVDQNDFGASVQLNLVSGSNLSKASGRLLSFNMVSSETGDGSVLKPAGQLLVFNADPGITAGDTSLTIAIWKTVIANISVAAADWAGGTTQGAAQLYKEAIVPFSAVGSLYLSFFLTSAGGYNGTVDNNEALDILVHYSREH